MVTSLIDIVVKYMAVNARDGINLTILSPHTLPPILGNRLHLEHKIHCKFYIAMYKVCKNISLPNIILCFECVEKHDTYCTKPAYDYIIIKNIHYSLFRKVSIFKSTLPDRAKQRFMCSKCGISCVERYHHQPRYLWEKDNRCCYDGFKFLERCIRYRHELM